MRYLLFLLLLSSCTMYKGVYAPVQKMPAAYQEHFRRITEVVYNEYKSQGYTGKELDSLTLVKIGACMLAMDERSFAQLRKAHSRHK